MTTADEAKLRQMFDTLLGAYNLTERKGEWEAWETWIKPLPMWAIGNAVMQAPDHWPAKFPNVGQIRTIVSGMVKRRREQGGEEVRDDAPAPVYDHIHPEFANLARVWEDESRKAGWDPDKPCPRSVGSRRIRELQKLWDRHSTWGAGVPLNPRNSRNRRAS